MELKEKISQHLYHLRVRLGITKPAPPDEIQEEEKDPEIPGTYLEQFSLDPLWEPTQILGREKDLEAIKTAYLNWQRVTNKRPFILIGEPGSGMTSFIHAASPFLDNPQIIYDDYRVEDRETLLADIGNALGIGVPDSIEKLAEQVANMEQRVVVFESLERLFIRRIGGFILLEDFRHIIQLTSNHIFWILTINEYPLYYLNRTLGIQAFINDIWELQVFEEGYIEDAIAMRNEWKGYHPIFFDPAQYPLPQPQSLRNPLPFHPHFSKQFHPFEKRYWPVFLKPAEFPFSLERAYGKADQEKKQQLLRDYFFKQLHAFAEGNISRALLFWAKSIKGIRGETVLLKPYKIIKSKTSLEDSKAIIDDHLLFALEAIFQHDSLSLEDLITVLRSSEQHPRLILTKLLQENWIRPRQRKNGRQEYQINLLYQTELNQLLRDRFNRNHKKP